jgi:hypothetical protein
MPVSNTVHQPAAVTSILESADQPPLDNNLRRLLDFVGGDQFNVNYVQLHINHIVRLPSVVPVPALWDIPGNLNVAKLVYDTVVSLGYIENVWPSLRLVMGTSVGNTEWCCNVLCTLGLFDVIRVLPYLEMNENF